jgi:hypothetical protein
MARGEIIYNTEKGNLEIPEYGRNVQNMVLTLNNIEDDDERQAYAEEIINLFAIMYPANRHLADYKEKLWNHLFRIGNYNLDLLIPHGVTIHRKDAVKEDPIISYPQRQFHNRHYGVYIQDLIAKALNEENPELREGYKEVIASYMKLAYRTWNKEHFVSDDIILQDLREMSDGQLVFDDDYSIENLVSMKSRLGGSNTASSNNWKRFGNKNNNNNNNRRNNNNNNNQNKNRQSKNFSKNRNVR